MPGGTVLQVLADWGNGGRSCQGEAKQRGRLLQPTDEHTQIAHGHAAG